jgi:hypothetical protein
VAAPLTFKVEFAFAATPTDEEISLAIAISDSLIAAGWKWVDWPGMAGPAVMLPHNPSIGRTILNGIEIFPFNPRLVGAANTLVDVLKPLELGEVRRESANEVSQDQNAPMIIAIMIGPRP